MGGYLGERARSLGGMPRTRLKAKPSAYPTLLATSGDGVRRALGRDPRPFADYVRTAAAGTWGH
ncbi:hypothetical protein ABZ912_29400 [Nonomuraea angiospora]|uniref:hypothetical protein n=1 Tax=Nonomuraea angiospora TaxID=46172 RepID=UPI0033FE1C37